MAGAGEEQGHTALRGRTWNPAYLLGRHGERAHLPRQVHEAQVLRAVAVDAVGVVAGADEHGAEQRAEVEAVAPLALEHRGRGAQVRGLRWQGQRRRPAAPGPSPHSAGLGPNRAPRLFWFGEPANGVKTTDFVSRESHPPLPTVFRGCGLPGGKDPVDWRSLRSDAL